MRKYALEFLRRGFVALGIGPIVLAILYLILRRHAGLESLSVDAVVIGIFSIGALAFIAGGAIGIGEITSIPTAPAITEAYYQWDKERRYSLPIHGTPYNK